MYNMDKLLKSALKLDAILLKADEEIERFELEALQEESI